MSTMSDAFDQAIEDIFSKLGVDAVFTTGWVDTDWVDTDCKVDLSTGIQNEPFGVDAQAWGNNVTIEAILSEIGKEPDKDDTFTIDGTVYTVQTVQENDGRTVKVVVK